MSSSINLKWVNTNLAAIREATLVYFKNTPGGQIHSVDVMSSALKYNLKTGFDSGASYQFQLQLTDVNDLTIYSNSINIVTPHFLIAPVINSIMGFDASLRVTLAATTNLITGVGGDTVEFVIKRHSDNALFWIVMPYVNTGIYNLVHGMIVNQDAFTIACMFQPSLGNVNYMSPSVVSNSMNGSPTNIPNTVQGAVTGTSVGAWYEYQARFNWARPSDFAEWNDNFTIHLVLTDSNNGVITHDIVNDDVTQYTFTGLDEGMTFKCSVSYSNTFGVGLPVESVFINVTHKPRPPALLIAQAGDQSVHLAWIPPLDFGQSPITGYDIVQGTTVIATVAGTDLEFDATGLVNGIHDSWYIRTKNAIGTSASSNFLTAVPFGPMNIVSCIPSSKTLTLTINPNGKPVERVIMLGLDADSTEELSSSIFDIPQNQISQTVNANIVVTKTFTGLSGDLNFHLAVVHCNSVVDFVRS